VRSRVFAGSTRLDVARRRKNARHRESPRIPVRFQHTGRDEKESVVIPRCYQVTRRDAALPWEATAATAMAVVASQRRRRILNPPPVLATNKFLSIDSAVPTILETARDRCVFAPFSSLCSRSPPKILALVPEFSPVKHGCDLWLPFDSHFTLLAPKLIDKRLHV